MRNRIDHATHGRGILERTAAMQLIEAETDKRLGLDIGPAVRTRDLLDRDRLLGSHVTSPSNSFSADAPAPAEMGLSLGAGFCGRAVAAASHDLGHLLVAACCDGAGVLLLLQRVERGADDVVGV